MTVYLHNKIGENCERNSLLRGADAFLQQEFPIIAEWDITGIPRKIYPCISDQRAQGGMETAEEAGYYLADT